MKIDGGLNAACTTKEIGGVQNDIIVCTFLYTTQVGAPHVIEVDKTPMGLCLVVDVREQLAP
ncbi:hypothetical protein brsh051_20650 [Brooklawnia propionicigenes]|uniref:Uncharacterized protein n=1 Tax=Brooklawnia propionicigenes TaxID=3041175 RepID=A0AAN0MHX2_9ACTN|nr:hypothetical protein brsh051_20650 [Brooklawnia sp. SH051]